MLWRLRGGLNYLLKCAHPESRDRRGGNSPVTLKVPCLRDSKEVACFLKSDNNNWRSSDVFCEGGASPFEKTWGVLTHQWHPPFLSPLLNVRAPSTAARLGLWPDNKTLSPTSLLICFLQSNWTGLMGKGGESSMWFHAPGFESPRATPLTARNGSFYVHLWFLVKLVFCTFFVESFEWPWVHPAGCDLQERWDTLEEYLMSFSSHRPSAQAHSFSHKAPAFSSFFFPASWLNKKLLFLQIVTALEPLRS